MRHIGLASALLIFILGSCERYEEPEDRRLDASRQLTLRNIPYGPNGRQVLDIALPAGRNENTPVVVFIHGGGWMAGDRSVFANEARQFAEAGLACAVINYRYASDIAHVHHPDLINDVRAAVDFIASKSKYWQVSPDRFGLMGQSAGGHLALITAYTRNDGRIRACASWSGLFDLSDPDQLAVGGAESIFKTYVGTPLRSADDTLRYEGASPYWTVNRYSVPTLLIHGTEDRGVPYANAVRMRDRLYALRVPHSMVVFNGAGHTWAGKYRRQAYNETLAWFRGKL